MARRDDSYNTIHCEGSLLPADVLERVAKRDLTGLEADDYHLSGERLDEAVSRSWHILVGAYANFRAGMAGLPAGDIGTTLTRERWLLPLFRELANGRLNTSQAFGIDGRSYPISHGWRQAPIHLVGCRLDLDKKRPGVAGAARHSPQSLLQIFLNRSDAHLWGFVSNGLKLRILRDNLSLTRQAYVEFDLQSMMESEAFSDFRLLWLLCHQSRVEAERGSDMWLERWMRQAVETGARARDQMRQGVKRAIEALGIGFIERPANGSLRDQLRDGSLDKQAFYRQLPRLVYRLLFLFVAEDRDLLLDRRASPSARQAYTRYYSTARLGDLAANFRGTKHSDLFIGLRLVMRLLAGHGDGAPLGIKPLGSFLFRPRSAALVDDCQISNRQLLAAIRDLSQLDEAGTRSWRNVDYRNLGPEEFGSVYESLLELRPEINLDARSFALSAAIGNERKTSGSCYTPARLIHSLLDSALAPVLDRAAKAGPDAILALKVCDPACGSGHFLIAAASRMAKRLASLRTGEEEPPPADIQSAKRDIISRCVYGVDINPMAAELCMVNLWIEAQSPGKPLSFLEHHIKVGNSLLGTTPALMADGIPDAAYKPIEGDDKKSARALRQQNRQERKLRQANVMQLGLSQAAADYGYLRDSHSLLDSVSDDSVENVREKEDYYAALASLRETVVALSDRYGFFHWHIAFPDVFAVPPDLARTENAAAGWDGGFDVVLGNPPWERIKIQEKEWFAGRDPHIAAAPGARRKQLIANLKTDDPAMHSAFTAAKRSASRR